MVATTYCIILLLLRDCVIFFASDRGREEEYDVKSCHPFFCNMIG